MLKFPKLFEPVKVGGVIFRNRIFGSPTGSMDFNSDHTPTEDWIAYYERKAMGGAATVTVGECHINPPLSRMGGMSIDLTNEVHMRFLYKLADRVSRQGAVASLELQHAGRYSNAAFGPSDGFVDDNVNKPCYAMSEEQIEQTIEDYAKAALMAKNYGFGMVTIHGGHGWLPQQFFSPVTNQRTDKWGGSAENRGRFAVAVCDAIHEKCGRDFPVEFRISATEFEDGYDKEEGIKYAMCLDGHADIIHCSVGIHGTTMKETSLYWAPSMFEPDGRNVKYAAEIKKHIKKSLVACVGAITDPNMMEEILASGKADIICLARALICDPDLPNKARAGKDDEIVKCIRCFECNQGLFPSFRIFCALNPEASREAEFHRIRQPVKKQTVLVAGGGVGGMQAAITCARQGHKVILCEKNDELGGVLLCERNVPFKKHLAEYIELQKRLISRLGVEVRLGCEVTNELIEAVAPDAVIASLGSKPLIPDIEGIDADNVYTASEIYADPDKAKGKILIIGGGLAGAELAVYLDILGKKSEIVEMGPAIHGSPYGQGPVVKLKLKALSIPVHFNTKAVRITKEGVACHGPNGEVFFRADTVVNAAGVVPLTDKMMKLSASSPLFYAVGDCDGKPGGIKHATETAHTMASRIGF
jgi:2,4-dienoyl-CoA reductase-like NADH-dependent reductase (Old Yellow Enzyme family)/thioredoxin reductase